MTNDRGRNQRSPTIRPIMHLIVLGSLMIEALFAGMAARRSLRALLQSH